MRNTRVYVGHLAPRTREADLDDIFSRYGRIRGIDMKNGYAFIEFDDPRDAEDAIYQMDDRDVDGSYIIVQHAKGGRDRERGGRGGIRGPSSRGEHRCFVEGIPRDMSWQDLKDLFRPVCDVVFTDIFTDRGGNVKGVVEFDNAEEMERAIRKLDRTKVDGRTIYIEEERGSRRSKSKSRSPAPRGRSSSRSPRKSRSPSPRRGDSPSRKRSRSRSRSRDRTSASPSLKRRREDHDDNDNDDRPARSDDGHDAAAGSEAAE